MGNIAGRIIIINETRWDTIICVGDELFSDVFKRIRIARSFAGYVMPLPSFTIIDIIGTSCEGLCDVWKFYFVSDKSRNRQYKYTA